MLVVSIAATALMKSNKHVTLKPCSLCGYMERGCHHSLKSLGCEVINTIMRLSSEIMVPLLFQYIPKKKIMGIFSLPSISHQDI